MLATSWGVAQKPSITYRYALYEVSTRWQSSCSCRKPPSLVGAHASTISAIAVAAPSASGQRSRALRSQAVRPLRFEPSVVMPTPRARETFGAAYQQTTCGSGDHLLTGAALSRDELFEARAHTIELA